MFPWSAWDIGFVEQLEREAGLYMVQGEYYGPYEFIDSGPGCALLLYLLAEARNA